MYTEKHHQTEHEPQHRDIPPRDGPARAV
jgi:hypothetical protein